MPRKAKPKDNEENEDATPKGEKFKPVKRKRVTPHEATVLCMDVGSSSVTKDADGVADWERSKQVVDWVLSRKIFTESEDHFSLMFFGHENTSNPEYANVYVHNEELEKAKIEWLKLLENEVKANTDVAGDYTTALIAALQILRIHCENTPTSEVIGKTVVLLSNLSGIDDKSVADEMLKPIVNGFKKLNAQLLVVGVDLDETPNCKAQEIGFGFIKKLLPEVGGTAYGFDEGLSHLKYFIPKSTTPRGQPFDLELGPNYSFRVQMYVKNQRASMKIQFATVGADDGVELKKVRRYETAQEDIAIGMNDIDKTGDEAFRGEIMHTANQVDKDDLAKAFLYGKTKVVFTPFEMDRLAFKKEGKQLQLVQFTKRENILPQFILSGARYFFPPNTDQDSIIAMSALVNAMLKSNVVALCRYAYNVVANPRLCCLIPKITQEGLPVLIHYIMPFSEDLRLFQFPALETLGNELSEVQLEYVETYIDTMMLVNDKDKPEKEYLRPRDVTNPKHQYQCQLLRHKAMHPHEPFPKLDSDALLHVVSAPHVKTENAQEMIKLIEDAFELQPNEYTKYTAFKKQLPHDPEMDEDWPIDVNGEEIKKEDDIKQEKESEYAM